MADKDHLEGRDVDAEFAAIVAGWHVVGEPGRPAAPQGDEAPADAAAPEETTPQDESDSTDDAPEQPVRPPVDPALFTPGFRLHSDPTSEEPPPGSVEALLDEHFEPEPVTLPAPEDLHFWGIVGGLVLGPLLILGYAVFGEGHSRWWLWAGFGALALGAVLLVLRQPVNRDEDDNGARV